MKKYLGLIIILICLFSFSYHDALALNQGDGKGKTSQTKFLPKTAADPVTTVLNINNITSFITADGFMPAIIGGSWNGSFPKGTVGAIYQEGIVWGGKVNDGQSPTIRVSGNTYVGGTTRLTRIVRVRPDYATADLTDDAANFFLVPNSQVTDGQIQQIRDQYAKDWNEWPANLGAPFEDKNGDGIYEPNIDIPGIPGASQTIWLSYDDRNSVDNYGAPPIGLKVNETLWGYAIANPLGNVIFKKVNVIYQGTSSSASNSTIDSMYLVQWADPDVGQYTDDFAGSDSTLGLGYAYNSTTNDAIYSSIGSPPPAVGYDFLQGVAKYTGNPADSAIVNLKWQHGYKSVNVNASGNPLSTFVYFAAGGAWGDPGFNYNGSLQWYNLMRGYQPLVAQTVFPPDVTNKPQGGDGTFLLSGDPVAGTGQIDGVAEGAGDRRIVCVTGPFSLSKGDTAEIVVSLIGGIGSNNLTSVSVLKFYDKFAQFAYDNLFNLPVYPAPTVAVTNLDGKVLLNWANKTNVDKVETPSHGGYAFQGYNVYQLPSSTTDLSKAVRLATFDVVDNVTTILDDKIDPATGAILQVPVEFGKNSGVSRFITLNNDAIRGNIPLGNGQQYYYAVTAYGYNPDPNVPYHALESSPVPLLAIPQSPNPGVRYTGIAGDTLKVTHTSSGKLSDGKVVPMVIDPTIVTGDNYKITFDAARNWTLTDATTGKTLLANQTNQTGNNNYLVTEGLQVKVIGPPLKGKSWSYKSASPANISPVSVNYTGGRWFTGGSHGGELFFGGVFMEPNFWGETSVTPDKYETVEIRFRPMKTYTDLNLNGKYDIGEPYVVDDPTKTQSAFMYTGFSGSSYEGFFPVPFTAWDVTDPANPRQLNVVIRDRDKNKQWDLHNQASPPDPLLPNKGDQRFNYTWITTSTYDPTGTHYGDGSGSTVNFYSFDGGNGIWDAQWTLWLDDRHTGDVDMLGEECTFTLVPPNLNLSSDVFTFTAPKKTSDNNLAKADVNKINVFPNPYYGFQSRETSRTGKYVTFNHLPAQATIRIFDLAGVQVRVINKNDNSQFINWDLLNQNNYPVASGIYVVYIDMPGVGATKILKVAVVQEEQILNVY